MTVQFLVESQTTAAGVLVPVRFFARQLHDGPETFDYLANTQGQWMETDLLWEAKRGLSDTKASVVSLEQAQDAASQLWGSEKGLEVVSRGFDLPGAESLTAEP